VMLVLTLFFLFRADTLWMCYCVDKDRGISPANFREMRQRSEYSAKEKRGKGWERVWEVVSIRVSYPFGFEVHHSVALV
jgi:hypothetical protein